MVVLGSDKGSWGSSFALQNPRYDVCICQSERVEGVRCVRPGSYLTNSAYVSDNNLYTGSVSHTPLRT